MFWVESTEVNMTVAWLHTTHERRLFQVTELAKVLITKQSASVNRCLSLDSVTELAYLGDHLFTCALCGLLSSARCPAIFLHNAEFLVQTLIARIAIVFARYFMYGPDLIRRKCEPWRLFLIKLLVLDYHLLRTLLLDLSRLSLADLHDIWCRIYLVLIRAVWRDWHALHPSVTAVREFVIIFDFGFIGFRREWHLHTFVWSIFLRSLFRNSVGFNITLVRANTDRVSRMTHAIFFLDPTNNIQRYIAFDRLVLLRGGEPRLLCRQTFSWRGFGYTNAFISYIIFDVGQV